MELTVYESECECEAVIGDSIGEKYVYKVMNMMFCTVPTVLTVHL